MRRAPAVAAAVLLTLAAGCDSRQPDPAPTISEVVITGGVFSAELSRDAVTAGGEATEPTEPLPAGDASVDVSAEGQLCYQLAVEDLDDPTAAHLHQGPEGDIGDVVAELEPPTEGGAQGCLQIDPEAAAQIVDDPAGHYVDVHAESGAAIRGQLQPQP